MLAQVQTLEFCGDCAAQGNCTYRCPYWSFQLENRDYSPKTKLLLGLLTLELPKSPKEQGAGSKGDSKLRAPGVGLHQIPSRIPRHPLKLLSFQGLSGTAVL